MYHYNYLEMFMRVDVTQNPVYLSNILPSGYNNVYHD